MKLESLSVLKWYSATLGLAAGAVIYAFLGFGPVLPGVLAFAGVSYLSLAAVRKTDEEASPFRQLSEFIAAAGIIAFLPLIFMADFLVALVIFLAFAQIALNFQTHEYRRFYLGIAVSFAGLCAGAAQAKSGFYLVFFLTYTIAASITIGYAYMAQRREVQTPQWDRTDRARVCLWVIGLAAFIYFILPRFPAGGLLSQPGSDHFYRNQKWEEQARQKDKAHARDRLKDLSPTQRNRQDKGIAEGLAEKGDGGDQLGDFHYRGFQKAFDINEPDEKGDRFSNRIVARMRADHPQYLRARIFDLFDGLHWHTSSEQTVKLSVGYNGVDLIPPEQYTSSRLQGYEIYIDYNLGDYVPAAAVPVKLNFPATAIGVDRFGMIRSPGALKRGTAYAVTSQYNLLHGRLFAELNYQPPPSCSQLPPDLDPRIAALAAEVTRGATSQLAAAVALEHHLRTHYQYDLNSVFTSQHTTPLSEFLFQSRKGHCEYFASALAVMLRTRNIPSRLVTGFSATNRNPLTGYYDIYALDGHAWVEAFVDDQGWVILEPTPYYEGPLPEEAPLSVEQINDYVKRQIKLRNALGLNKLTLTAMIHDAWQLLYLLFSAGLGYVKLFVITTWHWLTVALAIGLAAWIAWRQYGDSWRAAFINRKVTNYPAEQPGEAVAFYLSAIEDLLKLAGLNTPPGYTIESYLQNLESLGGGAGDPALAAAFNRIYYNREAGERQIVDQYRQLFQSLYQSGIRNLQSLARSGRGN